MSLFNHYEDMKAMHHVEIGVVWGIMGHPRSPTMSAFDRVHTTSYSTLI